ncbi:MAG: ABC transporter permease [Bradyrhizobium sp.]|nr:MAG: ABC transporter permease [Bradyrhizobium sp.]
MRAWLGNAALVGFFLATLALFGLLAPNFATASNFEDLMSGFSFVAILAMGQAFPILLKGIDLSIGATLALAGMIAFDLSLIAHWPGYFILPVVLAAATLAGIVNGLLIVYLRLQPFIATLASLAAYRGLVYLISGRQLVPSLSTTPISDSWILGLDTDFDVGSALGISAFVKLPWVPLSFFVMLLLLAALWALLDRTKFGRDVYAVGGNAEAARLAGIPVGRRVIACYGVCGFCAGVAALTLIARLTTATEALGVGTELTAIAAAVIGGVSLSGGVGGVFGPAIGAFLLGAVLLGLTLLGISQYVQQILTGAILLIAVGSDRALAVRRRNRLAANLAPPAPAGGHG